MAHAYTPGLLVTPAVRHRARRLLPLAGEVLVNVGDTVDAQQIVARAFLPGEVNPVNLANKLSVVPAEVASIMLKSEGDRIEPGDLLARTKGIFGFFPAEYRAECSGTLENVSSVTGQLIIRGAPIEVNVVAFLSGTVVELIGEEGVVIEADVGMIQGIFGIGGEAFGKIRMACSSADQDLTRDCIDESMSGQVVVGGARMTGTAIERAVEVGAAAVVAGGIDDQDLRQILGYDLGVAITGSERIGTTLVITEGFGTISMAERTFRLLLESEGRTASVNGATQIRAGVLRPEIVIETDVKAGVDEEVLMAAGLDVGAGVRIIRDPYFGQLGTVKQLPPDPQVLDSGSKARVLEVELAEGSTVVVPRANVELLEG